LFDTELSGFKIIIISEHKLNIQIAEWQKMAENDKEESKKKKI